MTRLAPLALLLASSCGPYVVGDLYEVRDVRVRIFDNLSERRIHEFDLTNAVVRELSARGIRVNSRNAAFTLEGRIIDIRNPSVVEGRTDAVLVGSLHFTVEARLVDREGKERWKDLKTEAVSFTAARGETLESARQEVFDRLARWILAALEKKW